MNKQNVTLQIYTGGFDSPPERIDIAAVIRKLAKIYQKACIDCVMIGWAPDDGIGEVVDFLKRNGTDVYLWLPVFSGWDGLAPLVNVKGEPVTQDYDAEKGERFDFGCPAVPSNIRHILGIFEKHYANREYDGVFLDKIRYPSFIDGTGPLLTCFCPHCREIHGISGLSELRGLENPLGITGYDDLRYALSDDGLTRLFEYKARVVTESVTVLSEYFRGHGYKVGLDLFAPFLSYFVGQEYGGLAGCADFIKPMFYRKTNAPAGIPFEIARYAGAFDDDPLSAGKRVRHLMGILGAAEIDVGFINRELRGIREKVGDTRVYAGIEVNFNERIAPVTRCYIEECVTKIKGADGFALSWDLCSTPDDNLDAAIGGVGLCTDNLHY